MKTASVLVKKLCKVYEKNRNLFYYSYHPSGYYVYVVFDYPKYGNLPKSTVDTLTTDEVDAIQIALGDLLVVNKIPRKLNKRVLTRLLKQSRYFK